MYFHFPVSNEVPEHPVISPVSGHIYEKRLIEKYIKENGTDPMTGDKLAMEMLLDVKGINLLGDLYYFKQLNARDTSTLADPTKITDMRAQHLTLTLPQPFILNPILTL